MEKVLIVMLLTATMAYGYDHDPLGLDRVDNIQRLKMEEYQNRQIGSQASHSFLMNNMQNTYRPARSISTDVEKPSRPVYVIEKPLYKFGGY